MEPQTRILRDSALLPILTMFFYAAKKIFLWGSRSLKGQNLGFGWTRFFLLYFFYYLIKTDSIDIILVEVPRLIKINLTIVNITFYIKNNYKLYYCSYILIMFIYPYLQFQNHQQRFVERWGYRWWTIRGVNWPAKNDLAADLLTGWSVNCLVVSSSLLIY